MPPPGSRAVARIAWLLSCLPIAACATQPSPGAAPGFFMGMLHGLFAPFSLVGSLFWDVRIYAFPNSGFGYDLGFVLGFGFLVLTMMLFAMARVGGFLTREGDS
jgi:hypothetical protein